MLFGDKNKLNLCVSKMSKKDASLIKNTCKFYYTTDNIGSNDDPINALRKKKIPASEKQWKQYQKTKLQQFYHQAIPGHTLQYANM